MYRVQTAFITALASLVVAAPAVSQTIATDRPDFVESSSTVGKGSIQMEGAVAFEKRSALVIETEAFTTPFLLRVGVADGWELRIESDWFTRSTTRGEVGQLTTNGLADFALGAKWAFFAPETGDAPSMAVLGHADLPTGSGDFRGDGMRPSIRITAEWSLPGDWGIGIMPGVLYDRTGDNRFISGIFGAVVGKGLTDSLRAFVELAFDQMAGRQYGGTSGYIDYGITFLLNPRWLLDAGFALGITDQAPDSGFTFGLSGLLPR